MKKSLLFLPILVTLVTLIAPASAQLTASVDLTPSILLPGDTASGILTLTNKGTASIKVTGVTFFSDLKVEPKSVSSIGYIPSGGSYELPFRIYANEEGLYSVEARIYTTNGTLNQLILVDVRDLTPEIVLNSAIVLNEVNTVTFTISDPIGVSNLKVEPLFDAEPKIIYLTDSEGSFTYYASEEKELKFRVSFYNGENYHEVIQTIMPEYRESKGVLLNVSLPYDAVCLEDVVPIRVELTNLRNDAIYSIEVTASLKNFSKKSQIAGLSSMESRSIEFLCTAKYPGEQDVYIRVEFKDALNNMYSMEKRVSFKVLEEKAISISNLEVKWNRNLRISGDVSNSGKSTVYNVMLAIQSDGIIKTYYLGKIEPSDFDTFEFSVENVTSATPHLIVTWNNELGERIEEVLPVKLPQKQEFEAETNPAIITISVVVFVAIIAIAGLAWIRRK